MNNRDLKIALLTVLKILNGEHQNESSDVNQELLNQAIDLSMGTNSLNATGILIPLPSIFSRLGGEQIKEAYLNPDSQQLVLEAPKGSKPDVSIQMEQIIKELEQSESYDSALNYLDYTLSNVSYDGLGSSLPVGLAKNIKLSLAIYTCLLESDHFLFIGGDLSGVQSYLYNIISTYASKNLKGRSFYLQLLTENVLHLLLEETGLSRSQIIYNSGGSFYLIAPRTDKILTALDNLRNRIQVLMYEEHQTDLFLALESVSYPITSLNDNGFASKAWQDLAKKLAKAKGQRYSNLIESEFDKVFGIKEVSSNRMDAITGEIINPGESFEELKKLGSDEEQRYVLAKTQAQIDLAKNLNRAKYWNIQAYSKEAGKGFSRPGLGLINSFEKSASGRNLKLNEPNPNDEWFLFGGNSYPQDKDGHPITFDKLVETQEAQGIARLGVLRMDVDNLGLLFKKGLGDTASFAAFSELSFRLDQFFKGHLNVLRERTSHRKESTYIIYSGGDDLFLIGQWAELLEFAIEIQAEFKAWTAGNPSLSISGGLALVKPSYPISKAAELAGEYEQLAKSFSHPITRRQKDALTLFGIPFAWSELDEVRKWMDFWHQGLGRKTLSHSFLYRLYQFRDQKNSKGPSQFSWQWNASYLLARQRKDKRIGEEDYHFILSLIVNGKGNYRALDLACIGARWAELLIR